MHGTRSRLNGIGEHRVVVDPDPFVPAHKQPIEVRMKDKEVRRFHAELRKYRARHALDSAQDKRRALRPVTQVQSNYTGAW